MHSKMGDYLMAEIRKGSGRGIIILFPSFEEDSVDEDLAIIKLPSAVKFTDTVRPICMPADDEEKYENKKAVVVGWGKDDYLNMSLFLKVQTLDTMQFYLLQSFPIIGSQHDYRWRL